MDKNLTATLHRIAQFYDERKVGDVGPLGFRRSTNLMKLMNCLDRLLNEKIIDPDKTRFLDLGCADGRVNVFLSYLAQSSVGIELDEWTLDEYAPLRFELDEVLGKEGLLAPPENISLFHGDSTDKAVHDTITSQTGIGFENFNLYYTYLIMHEEFAELIAEKAETGSFYIVYGLNKIMPKYHGLQLIEHLSPMEGILAIYRKI